MHSIYPEWDKSLRNLIGLVLALVAFGVLLAMVGCGSLDHAYLNADASTYNVIAPAHSAYIAADPTLNDEQRERRWRKLRSWKSRIIEGRRHVESE